MSEPKSSKKASLDVLRRFRDGPGWRHRQAQRIVASPQTRERPADRLVRRAVKHLQRRGQSSPSGDAGAPDAKLQAAQDLEQNTTYFRQLRIMALGGMDDKAISEHCGAPLPIVQIWRLLYFDVEGQLRMRGWIQRHVLVPLIAHEQQSLAREFELALALGPDRVGSLLMPTPIEAGENSWELSRAQLHLKGLEALEFCIDSPRAALEYLKLHTDLMCRERQLRLEEEKLAEQKREHQRSHELEIRRLAVEQAREENRAAELRMEAARFPAAKGSSWETTKSEERARPRGQFSAERQASSPFVEIFPPAKVA